MIDRRAFNKLVSLAVIGALTENVALDAQPTSPPSATPWSAETATGESALHGEVILEDKDILVAFDSGTGALTRLERKSTGWAIQRRPELGISFRLHAPLPHRCDNFVLGQKQHAVKVDKSSDHQVNIEWKNLLSEHGGVLPMTMTATAMLESGSLTFASTLINDSPLVVETIDYPYLGDLQSPTADATMTSEHMWYGNLVGDELYPHFHNEKGNRGVDFPTKTIDSKQSLFCLIQTPREGLSVEMRDPTLHYLLEYTFEQHPGTIQSVGDPVPPEIPDIPGHLEFRICHFVFAHPHSTVQLAPVMLRFYRGDWHAGVDLYKEWRATWFKPAHVPAWVMDIHSWRQLQITTPEENCSIPYRDLGKYVKECAENGVSAILLVGWNHGGQDRVDPSEDNDPELGTRQELHDAITLAQAMGVKIILFGKLNWADLTTAWYKAELYKITGTHPYGIPYQQGAYSYLTPTQLAGINNRRCAVTDFSSPGYRAIATREFQKILDLGAAGWLFDEVCHHGPVEYSFSHNHGYETPGYIHAGDIPMSKQLRAAADKVSPDFVFAGEGPEDWLMQYYPVSYFRIVDGSRPVCRYIDSQAPLMVAVTGIDDREKLNLILLNRYIISYEPYNFKGQLTAFPLTLAYGKKIDALRRKYKVYLWDAEFRDTIGADVTSNGSHRHSVFVTPAGKRAVVIANNGSDKAIAATVNLPNPGRLVVATPERPEARAVSGAVRIPARSAAVVMER